jgi:hypothetical protein
MASQPSKPADEQDGITPPPHNDGPSGRPESTTGAGREATAGDLEVKENNAEHRSGYGGKGGAPDTSSETRQNK